MPLTTGAKHKLYVSGTAPATFDQAGYEAITDWQLAPCPESLPELVKRLETVSYTCLHEGTTETARGAAEPVTFNPPIQDDPTNAAQILMKTAFEATNGSAAELISIKVENDGATQTFYLQARVFAFGSGERATNTVFLRIVEMMGDAATLVEV